MKKREKQMKEDLQGEREKRKRAESNIEKYKKRLQEMKAFQQTVQCFMHHSKGAPNTVSPLVAAKSDISTKPSTVNDERQPVPSFLKALSY